MKSFNKLAKMNLKANPSSIVVPDIYHRSRLLRKLEMPISLLCSISTGGILLENLIFYSQYSKYI